jgi:hypothetical protein
LFDRLCTKQFERTASDEGFGDGLAEIGGGGDDRSALYDVRDLIAVGRDDHRVQMMDLGFYSLSACCHFMAIRTEGELTPSAECGEDGALGGDGVLRGGAVEGADGGVDCRVARGVFRVERMLRAADL